MRTFLVIIDESDEARAAMRYAARRAVQVGGAVHILALVAQQNFSAFGAVQATIEQEARDRAEMLADLGLEEPALSVVARATYKTLGYQSYFTAGVKEIRAWTIPQGATGPQAASVIHTDFEKGFIRAEIFSIEHLEEYKSEKAIREAGKLRVEGKEYIMRDGDVCNFLVNP